MKRILGIKGLDSTIKKVIYTIIFIFIYTLIYNIVYPGIINIRELGLSNRDFSLSLGILSILSQSTRVYISSSIISNMLTMLSSRLEKLKDKKESRLLYEQMKLIIATFLSIVQSNISIKYIESYIIPSYKSYFFMYFCLINITLTYLTFWINRQLVLNGIGQGVTLIIGMQALNRVSRAYSLLDIIKFIFSGKTMFFYLVLLVSVCIIFENIKVDINTKVVMSRASYSYSKDHALSSIEYKPINSNILANVLASQTLGIYNVLKEWLSNNKNITVYGQSSYIFPYLDLSSFLSNMWYYLLILLYNYIYNAVYFSNVDKILLNMRSNLIYILNIPFGKSAEKVIEIAIIVCSIISFFMTVFLLKLPVLFSKLDVRISNISSIDFIIVINSFIHIFKFFIATYMYHSYSFDTKLLGSIAVK